MKGKIFNAQEVQAIIAGNKTMFREVIKEQPPHDFKTTEKTIQLHNNIFCNTGENYDFYFGVAPYQVGQKIFVKEAFENLGGRLAYQASNPLFLNNPLWKPAQHMKQEQSRITLRIKSVKVESLQDISEEDAIKEGMSGGLVHLGYLSEIDAFSAVWNSTHKKQEEKWEANPWVWVVDFKINK